MSFLPQTSEREGVRAARRIVAARPLADRPGGPAAHVEKLDAPSLETCFDNDLPPAMLYEMIGIVRPGKLHEVKEIAKSAGTIILNSGGVVRGVTNWGVFQLPKPTRKHQMTHTTGHHFILRFDASSAAQHTLRRTMSLDPRLIRYTMVKLGSRLDDIADVPGTASWGSGLTAMDSDPVGYAGLGVAQRTMWQNMKVNEERKESQILKDPSIGTRQDAPSAPAREEPPSPSQES